MTHRGLWWWMLAVVTTSCAGGVEVPCGDACDASAEVFAMALTE